LVGTVRFLIASLAFPRSVSVPTAVSTSYFSFQLTPNQDRSLNFAAILSAFATSAGVPDFSIALIAAAMVDILPATAHSTFSLSIFVTHAIIPFTSVLGLAAILPIISLA